MEATAKANIPPRLKERYQSEVRGKLQARFAYSSVMEVPRLEKITLNMGVGEEIGRASCRERVSTIV